MNFRRTNSRPWLIKSQQDLTTVADILKRSRTLESVSESARLDTELLLSFCLGKDRSWLYTWPEKKVSSEQIQKFEVLFNRRLKGEPLAYILGEKDFWSLSLNVNSSTLIPRPETELIVETILERVALESNTDLHVLDLGTGSGAIALSIAKELPSAKVLGVDNKTEIIALAKSNADKNSITNVNFILSHWFESLGNFCFDFIVSNPPYIESDDEHLTRGDVRYEPKSALVAEAKGLADLKHIIENGPTFMKSTAWLILEHGWTQGESVRTLMKECGYQCVETRKDFAACERVTLGQRPNDD